MSDEIPAGWYPDPSGQHGERWWDGGGWTDHTRAAAAPPPVPADAATDGVISAPAAGPAAAPAPTAAATRDSAPRGRRWGIPVALGLTLLLVAGGAVAWWQVDERLTERAEAVADADAEADELRERLVEQQSRLEELEADLAARDERIGELEAELDVVQARETPGDTDFAGSSDGGGDIVAGEFRFSQVEVRRDFVDDFEIRARMTNEGPVTRDFVDITATIFDANDRILAVLTGFEFNVVPGQTITVTITGFDDYTPDWDFLEIAVEY